MPRRDESDVLRSGVNVGRRKQMKGVEFAASKGDDKEKWFVTEVDRAGRRELIELEDEQGCTQLG